MRSKRTEGGRVVVGVRVADGAHPAQPYVWPSDSALDRVREGQGLLASNDAGQLVVRAVSTKVSTGLSGS